MKKFMEPKLELLAYAVEECVSVSTTTTTEAEPEPEDPDEMERG